MPGPVLGRPGEVEVLESSLSRRHKTQRRGQRHRVVGSGAIHGTRYRGIGAVPCPAKKGGSLESTGMTSSVRSRLLVRQTQNPCRSPGGGAAVSASLLDSSVLQESKSVHVRDCCAHGVDRGEECSLKYLALRVCVSVWRLVRSFDASYDYPNSPSWLRTHCVVYYCRRTAIMLCLMCV